ncbi:MAG: HAMP domain-containing histidine kinase [Burkholderiales bacterium]|nr:HAMP domain-containing histidine kinase [Phycisphaerae bacterium]
MEVILAEWEAFARSVWPGPESDPRELRDHAMDILRAAAMDMKSAQTAAQQSDKSKGDGDAGQESDRIDGASDVHAVGRVRSGFDMMAVVAEYRALRASVVRLWRESRPDSHPTDLADLTRFNESIDQSLTEAVRSYTERVDRSRRMFLAILGHDLRNPLNAILMSAGALGETKTIDPASARIAGRIANGAAAMGRMINDLLDFTGTALSGRMPLTRGRTDLGALCRQVVDEMRAAHPDSTLRLTITQDLTGDWDAARLRQVISNLLGNALQHGAGPIDLAAVAEGADVVLSVKNGGPPIPPDAIATIFEPLVREASSEQRSARNPGSIGLGLYIAREVITAHGGTISLTSSVDAGTTFTVRLPGRRCE